MQVVSVDEFTEKTLGGWPPQMDLSIYLGLDYECVCGKHHLLKQNDEVLRELSKMRLVIACPNEAGITCVRIRGFIRRSLESQFGTQDLEETD